MGDRRDPRGGRLGHGGHERGWRARQGLRISHGACPSQNKGSDRFACAARRDRDLEVEALGKQLEGISWMVWQL
jgi:hypothetical protein